MATSRIRSPREDQPLEGSGGGGGVRGTRWSSIPSFRGNSSAIDDLRKIASDTSNLKGAAKAAKEEAIDRAVTRTGIRSVGAGAAGAAVKAITPAKASEDKQEDFDSGDTADKNYDVPGGFSGRGMKKGGKVSSASRRADGIAKRGKTRGRLV